MIKAIFWDFDGVIADSVNVKTDAFYEMYLSYGKHIADKVRQYHLNNGGVSRYLKFEYFQTEFLGEKTPIPETKINELAERFSELVLKKVVSAPYIRGVVKVIQKHSTIVDNYVVSGTPQVEMQTIIDLRDLSPYFKNIYGSPENKDQLSTRILDEYGYKSEDVIFIGDALSDYEAAQHCGLHFILRRHKDNSELFKDYNSYAIDDFMNFDALFEKINKCN